MARYGREMVEHLLAERAVQSAIRREAIPAAISRPERSAASRCLCRPISDWTSSLRPKLVEIQGFPSLYAYQPVLAQVLSRGLRHRLVASRRCRRSDTRRVPVDSAARPSSAVTIPSRSCCWRSIRRIRRRAATSLSRSSDFGVRAVDISTLRQRTEPLFYDRDGKLTPIRRIYNRAIVDELERRGIEISVRLARRPRRRVGRAPQLVLPAEQVLAAVPATIRPCRATQFLDRGPST